MAHIFDLNYFYVAIENNNIMAITACTNGKTPPIQLNKHLVNHSYPFEVSAKAGSIEFVTTALAYRGKGAASGLITHIMGVMSYSEYVLEVADNNTVAVHLYEKLGFTEFMRIPVPKQGGFSYLVYMKKERK